MAEPPYPNPDQDGSPAVVQIQGPGSMEVHWAVFTTAFRKIREGNSTLNGSGSISWDLKDRSGSEAARGLYYLRLEIHSAGGTTKKTFKVLLLH